MVRNKRATTKEEQKPKLWLREDTNHWVKLKYMTCKYRLLYKGGGNCEIWCQTSAPAVKKEVPGGKGLPFCHWSYLFLPSNLLNYLNKLKKTTKRYMNYPVKWNNCVLTWSNECVYALCLCVHVCVCVFLSRPPIAATTHVVCQQATLRPIRLILHHLEDTHRH